MVSVFSVAIVLLGLSSALGGKWLESVGPRCVGVVSACLWGSDFIVGGAGICFHQLWLLCLGYGVLGGVGLGTGYVLPVSTLIGRFPDRGGFATGMAIMGLGGGAIIAAPLNEFLIKTFYEAPDCLGMSATVPLITEHGRQFAEVGGALAEIVVVGAAGIANVIVPGVEGVYVAGTERTGAAQTFFALGVTYFCVMLAAAFAYRVPVEDRKPAGWCEADAAAAHDDDGAAPRMCISIKRANHHSSICFGLCSASMLPRASPSSAWRRR